MRIIQHVILLFVFSSICVAVSRAADIYTDPPSDENSPREYIIESELQAAAEQVRQQAHEQTQASFRNFEKKLSDDIDSVKVKDGNAVGNIKKSSETNLQERDNVTYDESSQEGFKSHQDRVNSEITEIKSESQKVAATFDPVEEVEADPQRARLKKVELALQVASHRYKTDKNWPNVYSYYYVPSNQAEKNGRLYGVYASYTYRRPYHVPVHSWKDLSRATGGPGELFTFARGEADLSFGQVDYDSFVSGKRKGFNAWQGNVRGVAGYDFSSQDLSFMVTPYTGVGYRRFTDKTGGWVDWVIQDYAPYENVYNYIYVPVGVETLKHFNEEWDLGFKIESSYVFAGSVEFKHSDIKGIHTLPVYPTNIPTEMKLQDATSHLKGGLGFKTSFKIIRKYEHFNIFTEPFFEFWKLRKSKPEVDRAVGLDGTQYITVNNDDGSPYRGLFEPSSFTVQYGLRLGVQF